MMRHVQRGWDEIFRPDADHVNIRVHSWFQSIVGFVIAAVGGLIVYGAFYPASKAAHAGRFVLGIVVMLAGVHILVRGGCEFDRTARTVTRWWGLVFRARTWTISWDEVNAVKIRTSRITKQFSIARGCDVVLDGPRGAILVKHVKNFDKAWELAVALSEYLGIENRVEMGPRPGDVRRPPR